MSKRKIGKREAAEKKKWSLFKSFHDDLVVCIHNGIVISPECITNGSAWRIVIEKHNKNGDVLQRMLSDDPKLKKPKVYSSIDEYELKVLELISFYAGSFG